jgi:predicted phosphodiesterase
MVLVKVDGTSPIFDFEPAHLNVSLFPVIRIFSDLHYGDRASAWIALKSLRPLFDGADEIVLNGDTVDTRPSPTPETSALSVEAVRRFFSHDSPAVTWLTGNHDPDISEHHLLELAQRDILVTHGDILFESLVPWGRDARVLERRIQAELSVLPLGQRQELPHLFRAVRRAAASIPQRHQAEKNPLKYAVGFVADTIWPPTRVLKVLQAWRETPARAASFLEQYAYPARFFIMGHTHRLGFTKLPGRAVLINTGSLCPPGEAGVVDVSADRISLRRVFKRAGEFRLGETIAAFALAETGEARRLTV